MRRDPVGFARSIGVRVGQDCRLLGLTPTTFGSEPYLITIGDHVTVTAGVRFITHDGGAWVFRREQPDIDVVEPITIEDNVFVGLGATLMPGVTIGRDSVVAAGALVTKDVPPRSIAGGVPARVLCTIDEYWERNHQRFLPIRNLPPDEKRAWLLRHFGMLDRL